MSDAPIKSVGTSYVYRTDKDESSPYFGKQYKLFLNGEKKGKKEYLVYSPDPERIHRDGYVMKTAKLYDSKVEKLMALSWWKWRATPNDRIGDQRHWYNPLRWIRKLLTYFEIKKYKQAMSEDKLKFIEIDQLIRLSGAG